VDPADESKNHDADRVPRDSEGGFDRSDVLCYDIADMPDSDATPAETEQLINALRGELSKTGVLDAEQIEKLAAADRNGSAGEPLATRRPGWLQRIRDALRLLWKSD
jgi:hypothetical protein